MSMYQAVPSVPGASQRVGLLAFTSWTLAHPSFGVSVELGLGSAGVLWSVSCSTDGAAGGAQLGAQGGCLAGSDPSCAWSARDLLSWGPIGVRGARDPLQTLLVGTGGRVCPAPYSLKQRVRVT